MAPIFIYLFLSPNAKLIILSEVLFLIAGLTDIWDGWYARKYNIYTKTGAFLDPLADKLLIGAAFYVFFKMNYIPFWMFLVIIFRDIIVTLIRNYALSRNREIKTSKIAKLKTFSQFMFIAYIMFPRFFYLTNWFGLSKVSHELLYSNLTFYLMLSVTIFTVYTLLDYLYKNNGVFKT